VAPILETYFECLPDQQAPEAAAIQEQLARDGAPALEVDGSDKTVLGPQMNVDNLSFDASHAPCLGVASQVSCIKARIKMKCVAK
jgi:hypothetical protein